jgi:NCAIR mutase (PurE)-related protein
MKQMDLKEILQQVQLGLMSTEEAFLQIKEEPFVDIDFAKIDLHRSLRQGAAEVIYGAGKTKEQILKIVQVMREKKSGTILITRMKPEAAEYLSDFFDDLFYEPLSGVGVIGGMPEADGIGNILVATGGTSDIPVAEEAALTAQALGNQVVRLYDVGVAGIHRLLSHMDEIMSASVIVVIAGMEGALASAIGGLADCPIIAVPTSVGYGASFGGLSALLAMLNSCASGVSVVNIDNGFGAAYQASMINHMNKGHHPKKES